MKKFIVIIFIVALLIFCNPKPKNFTLLDYFAGEYSVYTETKLDESIDLGFCYMSNNRVASHCLGESVKMENLEPISALRTLNAQIISTEMLENGTTVMYAYSKLIDSSVELNNRKVNLQIAHNDCYTVIGWPLILGSF